MLIEISLGAILVLGLVMKLSQRPKGFPPGPRGLPLVGYAPFTGQHDPKYPHRAMMKLSEIYGPVAGFFVGPKQPFISVCGYEAVKEALHLDALNGRPVFGFPLVTDGIYREQMGVMFSRGDKWQEHRRFSLRHLRDLGFGRSSIETQMLDEVHDLIQYIKTKSSSHPNSVVDFTFDIFNTSAINVLWIMIAGTRFRRDDENFQSLVYLVDKVFRTGNPVSSLIQLPEFLYNLFPILREYFGVRFDLSLKIQKFVLEVIEKLEREKTSADKGEESEPNNFIQEYLNEMDRQKLKTDSTFTKEQLIGIILDLFGAGTETSSNSIGFALLCLLHHPDCQERMQAELDEVCSSSLPSLTDRPRLSYTEAVLMEVHRFTSVAPSTVPHFAMEDTRLRGYIIPKGSIVIPNLCSVHMDPTYWKDPEVFRPERHLTPDGKIIKTDHLIPFGIGKRACMGEPLARNTFFLFTAALVKTFQFKPLPNEPLPTLEPRNGFTLAYEPFKAIVIPRGLSDLT